MSTYYINTKSLTQDGLTPETGFKNVSELIVSEGPMTEDMIVEVVENDTPIIEPSLQIIAGTFKPYNKPEGEGFSVEMFSSSYKLKSSI